MRWLFAVFVASLCALLWAAISVARHVRHDRTPLPPETVGGETEMEQDKL
jgi:multisubunit Na+/H+ antiporter MnhE subunit